MGKFNKEAQAIIKAVGGKKNIYSLTYCSLRLRFVLVEPKKVKVDDVEKAHGVKATFTQTGQFQVVIGNEVKKFYEDLVEIIGEENLFQSGVRYEDA